MRLRVPYLGGYFNYVADARDVELREQAQKIQSLEDACQDLDGTIGQFRELVMQLQG